MRRIIALCLLAVVGCSQATYPKEPKNSLTFNKGAFGTSLNVVNAADTTVTIDDLKVDPVTKELSVEKVDFNSRQSVNQEKLLGQMTEFTQQLLADNERHRIYGENAVKVLDAVTRMIPTIAPIIGGFNQVAIANHRPGIVADLTKLLTEINKFDPTILKQVIANVSPAPATSPTQPGI